MEHPLDDMLANLKVIRDGDVEAYLDPYDYTYGRGYDDLCVEEVALARMIFRWDAADLSDAFFNQRFRDDWPELPDEITSEWLEMQADEAGPKNWKAITGAWFLPLGDLLAGCQAPLVEPDVLFSVGFLVDGGATSWAWSWQVNALTERLAVFGYWGEDVSGCLPLLPRGFVNRSDLFRSVALLLQNAWLTRRGLDGDRFGDGGFWDEMDCSHISLPELYRLLLAATGRGGSQIITLDGDALVNYREPGMLYGFREVEQLLSRKR